MLRSEKNTDNSELESERFRYVQFRINQPEKTDENDSQDHPAFHGRHGEEDGVEQGQKEYMFLMFDVTSHLNLNKAKTK